MKETCPKIENCRLFNDQLLKRKESAETYKNLYCRDPQKHKECKRYVVSEQVGRCADFVLPNSSYSVEEIIERMKKQALF